MLRVGGGGGGGGVGYFGALRYRGGHICLTYFAEEGVLFKTSECPRFCIKRIFFFNQVRSMGGGGGDENHLTVHEIYAALTPSDSRSDMVFRVCCRKLNRQRIINSLVKIRVPVHPM